MILEILPGTASGRMTAPPSKSMAHRDLICGALSGGSTVTGLAWSDDIMATLSCLVAIGAKAEKMGNDVKIGGLDPVNADVRGELYCHESGSTLRFLIPLCLLSSKPITLCGTERLFARPLDVYAERCRELGLKFKAGKNSVQLCGPLKSGKYSVAGNLSSQFISGLLFALPLLPGDSVIDITGAIESLSYIKLTLKALGDFGIRVTRADEHTLFIPGGQRYRARNIAVEGDYSNAAFFEALNVLGGNIVIEGLAVRSHQGDRVYRKLLPKLCKRNSEIDLTDCPDLAPILFAVAAAKGGAVFTGTARLKIKESDRAQAMKEELAKFGVPVIVEENRVTVLKSELKKPTQLLYGHNDHRIVMALSVLCTLTGGRIAGAQAVAKSYPDFFRQLAALGIGIKVEEE